MKIRIIMIITAMKRIVIKDNDDDKVNDNSNHK